ncbi:hypothetical protein EO087_07035 [Dyella sp. M7H15-1]|uniref:hypothetical protein n=1 Tax=Dyella sp. M7H15-1 TaxID=2501295 RepID=UPI0010050233|nr:hypothetical protein [Dyella sp. M7H15-1]QAU23765.1 hypothetical protein EO087_07035 [Dyella sp. M7H15-1]
MIQGQDRKGGCMESENIRIRSQLYYSSKEKISNESDQELVSIKDAITSKYLYEMDVDQLNHIYYSQGIDIAHPKYLFSDADVVVISENHDFYHGDRYIGKYLDYIADPYNGILVISENIHRDYHKDDILRHGGVASYFVMMGLNIKGLETSKLSKVASEFNGIRQSFMDGDNLDSVQKRLKLYFSKNKELLGYSDFFVKNMVKNFGKGGVSSKDVLDHLLDDLSERMKEEQKRREELNYYWAKEISNDVVAGYKCLVVCGASHAVDYKGSDGISCMLNDMGFRSYTYLMNEINEFEKLKKEDADHNGRMSRDKYIYMPGVQFVEIEHSADRLHRHNAAVHKSSKKCVVL